MEPPTKRMRMSPPDGRTGDRLRRIEADQPNSQYIPANIQQNTLLISSPTFDSQIGSESAYTNDHDLRKREDTINTPALLARTPDVTVTASVLNLAIVASGSTTQTTQVSEPSSDSIVAIASLGTLTIPGSGESSSTTPAASSASSASISSASISSASISSAEVTKTTSGSSSKATYPSSVSALSELSQISTVASTSSALSASPVALSLSSGLPASSSSSFSSSVNHTSTITSSDKTFTITATANLAVTYNNGTFIAATQTAELYSQVTNSKNSSSAVATGGSSSKATDSSSLEAAAASSASSSYHFGDPVASSTGTATASHTILPGAGGIAQTTTSSGSAPASSDAGSESGGGSGISLTPQQQQVVGGVVGGIASVALVLVALLYFLKWYRRRLKSQGRLPEQIQDGLDFGEGDEQALTRNMSMVESSRSSVVPILALASRFKKQFHHNSTTTMASHATNTTSESDKGFQRISGRKIPSVLSSGGDGYGNTPELSENQYPPFPYRTPKHTSWFRLSKSDETPEAPFLDRPASLSEPTTPIINPFLDPPTTTDVSRGPYSPGLNTSTRDFAAALQANTIRSQMGSMKYPIRGGEGYAALQPSPARTPVMQSPTGGTFPIAQAYSTPPLLNGDVPDLPPVPILSPPPYGRKQDTSKRNVGPPSRASVGGLTARSMSGYSARTISTGGKFKEVDIS